MSYFSYPSTTIVVAHALIVVVITVRVIMRRPATGVALAWLFLVALLPFAGALIYFLIGERRIGRRIRSAIPVDDDLGADPDRTDVVLDIHPLVMPAGLRG